MDAQRRHYHTIQCSLLLILLLAINPTLSLASFSGTPLQLRATPDPATWYLLTRSQPIASSMQQYVLWRGDPTSNRWTHVDYLGSPRYGMQLNDMQWDHKRKALVFVDTGNNSLWHYDPRTQQALPLPNNPTDFGAALEAPIAVAVNPNDGNLLVLEAFTGNDPTQGALLSIDPANGHRTILANHQHGYGPLPAATGLMYDPRYHRVLMSYSAGIVAVELDSGVRYVVSDAHYPLGLGSALSNVDSILSFHTGNHVLLTATAGVQLSMVNLVTGDRTPILNQWCGRVDCTQLTMPPTLDADHQQIWFFDAHQRAFISLQTSCITDYPTMLGESQLANCQAFVSNKPAEAGPSAAPVAAGAAQPTQHVAATVQAPTRPTNQPINKTELVLAFFQSHAATFNALRGAHIRKWYDYFSFSVIYDFNRYKLPDLVTIPLAVAANYLVELPLAMFGYVRAAISGFQSLSPIDVLWSLLLSFDPTLIVRSAR